MSPYREIVNPVLWEIGHIAWFHEYWTLRCAARRAPLIERCVRLAVGFEQRGSQDSVGISTCPTTPAPAAITMADVLARQEELLSLGASDEARYFYELSIRHEDMHVEAQAYMRQTSSNAPTSRPRRSTVRPSAGTLAGDVLVPGGSWRLGLDRIRKGSFSTTRSGRVPSSSRRSVLRAPP